MMIYDIWERMVLSAGMDPRLAAFGKNIMRECVHNFWEDCFADFVPEERLVGEWCEGGILARSLEEKEGIALFNLFLKTDGMAFISYSVEEGKDRNEEIKADWALYHSLTDALRSKGIIPIKGEVPYPPLP